MTNKKPKYKHKYTYTVTILATRKLRKCDKIQPVIIYPVHLTDKGLEFVCETQGRIVYKGKP